MKTKRFKFPIAGWFFAGILAASLGSPTFGDTLIVTNLADSGPGTFRDRIAASASGDIIRFGVFGTITLNTQLTISKTVRIEGPGVTFLKVSGNNSNRVFNITAGSVEIYNMIISDGRVVGTNGAVGFNGENVSGGGIRIAPGATLSMSVVIVSNNVVVGGQGGSQNQSGSSGSGGNAFGGGIANFGQLIMTTFHIVDNSATGGLGGPVSDGAFPGVGGQAWGGGLYTEGSATLISSTISDNSAIAGSGIGGPGGGSGGGIYNAVNLGVFVSTIASNTASGSSFDLGGGISSSGTLAVRDCTIAGNHADFGGGFDGNGDFSNTILAANTAGFGPDGSGSITSSDFNLIQNTSGLTITGATTHNITGQDPMLGPLRDNGGGDYSGFLTFTMALSSSSPAIDKGNSPNVEQRLAPRPFDFPAIANASGGNGSDIGAFELGIPVLKISRNSTNVTLSWPDHYGDFIVQSVPVLGISNNWISSSNGPVKFDNQLIFTESAATGNKFYRLKNR